MLFKADTAILIGVISAVIGVFIAVGVMLGRRFRDRFDGDRQRESLGVFQGALLGFVGLLLAFGLSMAVGRYEDRRTLLVDEANAIGTAYLRSQLLKEPERTQSIDLLREYSEWAVVVNEAVPETEEFSRALSEIGDIQQDLWRIAGETTDARPQDTAPRLYVESLNDMIDLHMMRVASLMNRVPGLVWILQIVGSAVALGALAMHLSLLGRGLLTPLLAGVFVVLILFTSFDLDRPRRGFIHVPSTVLVDVRALIGDPPVADAD